LSILARDAGMDHPRLGLIVPRRHVKRAVERNRIKRQIRECFRESQAVLPPLDIVVMTHAAASGCEKAQLRASLAQGFEDLTRKFDEGRR
jgi:ribonuclease P protein component